MVKKNEKGLYDLSEVVKFFDRAREGVYGVDVKRVRGHRSSDQNKWLWGCVYPMMLEGLLEAGWEFVSVDQVHEWSKKRFSQESVVNRHTGEVVTFPYATSMMDTLTFASYCEVLRGWAEEYLGVEIPDPDTEWMTKRVR